MSNTMMTASDERQIRYWCAMVNSEMQIRKESPRQLSAFWALRASGLESFSHSRPGQMVINSEPGDEVSLVLDDVRKVFRRKDSKQ